MEGTPRLSLEQWPEQFPMVLKHLFLNQSLVNLRIRLKCHCFCRNVTFGLKFSISDGKCQFRVETIVGNGRQVLGDTKFKSGTIAYNLNNFWAISELDSSLKWVEMSIKVVKC